MTGSAFTLTQYITRNYIFNLNFKSVTHLVFYKNLALKLSQTDLILLKTLYFLLSYRNTI